MVFKSVLHEKTGFSYIQIKPHIRVGIIREYICTKTIPGRKNNLQQTYPQIVLLFSKAIAYRVYDEFDESEIEYQKNSDLIVCTEMPVDTWLTGYLLSFGAQVEIIEPKYLKGILAEQAQEIYKKINLDKRCQDIRVILMTITIQLYRNFNHN